MKRLPLLLAAAAGALAGPAEAGTGVPGARCLEIEDPHERLACFDRAIGMAVSDAERETGAMPAVAEQHGQPRDSAARVDPGPPDERPREASRIDTVWGLLPDSRPAYVRAHRANYFLPVRYTTDVNLAPYQPLFDAFAEDGDFDDVEARFQLSFKGRLAATSDRRWGLWFAYTQQSHWQVYSTDVSSPFRETNYEPEIFVTYHPDVDIGDLRFNLLGFGINHQSNGRADPISRSWDRLFVETGFERGNLVVLARAWARIRPAGGEDDNPDIVDYVGNGEITAFYKWRDNSFSLMGRANPRTGKGAVQFTWATRPLLGPLRGYLQVFSGYGESLIDYDWGQTTIGIGVTLNEQF